MRDTNQMDLNELRLITTAIQQQELQTEDNVVRLTGQMQRLSVNQPRFLKFCSWQAMELFALGMGVAGVAVIQHQNKTISNQKETITHLHKTLRQEQQMHKQDVLFLYDNLKIDVAEEQQIHKQAISFLYDKMKEAHTVAFKTQNFDTQGAEIPVPDGFEKQDCSFFVAGRCHHGVLSNHQEYASEYTVSGFTAFPWGGVITAITKMVHMLS